MFPADVGHQYFFQTLVDELRDEHHFTRQKKGLPGNVQGFSTGANGVLYRAVFARSNRTRVELNIDVGDASLNKALLNWLHEKRNAIETATGAPLQWERLDASRSSRIAVSRSGGINDSAETLIEIRDWMICNLLAFKRAFEPLLKEYLSAKSAG